MQSCITLGITHEINLIVSEQNTAMQKDDTV